jgi:hypothetical protein
MNPAPGWRRLRTTECPLRVGFCRSENAKAAAQQFFYAFVRFVRHTGLLNTVEPTAALAEEQSLPKATFTIPKLPLAQKKPRRSGVDSVTTASVACQRKTAQSASAHISA